MSLLAEIESLSSLAITYILFYILVLMIRILLLIATEETA